MTVEAREDPTSRLSACKRIGGGQLGINPEALRGWVTQAEVDVGQRPGMTSADAVKIAELEREAVSCGRRIHSGRRRLRRLLFAAEPDRPSR